MPTTDPRVHTADVARGKKRTATQTRTPVSQEFPQIFARRPNENALGALTSSASCQILSGMESPSAASAFDQVTKVLGRLRGVKLLCVDLFDTVITRAVAEPSSVYLLLGQQLASEGLISKSPELFARARAMAEKRARAHAPPPSDITLERIYRELTHAHPRLEPRRAVLMERELRMEAQLIRPVFGAATWLAARRAERLRIAFVSDMYLPETFLKEQLEALGLWSPKDRLYVSSARGCMKARDGALFRDVLEQERTAPQEAVHVGNNWTDDYLEARRVGLHAVHFPKANPNRYEEALEAHRWGSTAGSSLLAGASRLARLAQPTNTPHERALVDVAAGVGAPLLVGFLLWTLQRAREEGITRLYYLSREGQIMHRLAERLCQRLGFDIDNRYLYVSRRALNLALLDKFTRDDLQWALTHAHEQDIGRILTRLSLSLDDIVPLLPQLKLSPETWHRPLDETSRRLLLDQLAEEPCRSVIQQRSAAVRVLAEGYLQQAGVFDDVTCGLVDSGGLGSQMRTLSLLRTTRGLAPVTGFAVYRDGDPQLPLQGFPDLHVYIRDITNGVGHARVKGMWEMLEMFCSADHGTVSGYEHTHEGIVPRFEGGRTARVAAWGLPLVQKTFCVFADVLACETPVLLEALLEDAREAFGDTLTRFWNNPHRDEAAAWGCFPWELDAGPEETELAWPLSTREALSQQTHARVWPAGSERRSATHVRVALRLGRAVPRPLRSLVRAGVRSLRRPSS